MYIAGSSVGNSLGAIAFMYSASYCLMSLVNEDEGYTDLKNCLSGGLTGALYKSSAGLKKSAMGAAFGISLAAMWSFAIRKNETVSYYV